MTVKKDIITFLQNNSGEYKSRSIAQQINSKRDYVTRVGRELVESGVINGKKKVPVISYAINNQLHFPGNNRTQLLQLVRKYGNTGQYSRAQGKSVSDIQTILRNEIADYTPVVSHAWVFWT